MSVFFALDFCVMFSTMTWLSTKSRVSCKDGWGILHEKGPLSKLMSLGRIMFASQYSLNNCHISGFTRACKYPSWTAFVWVSILEASAKVSALSFQSSSSSWLTESHNFSGLISLATETLLGGRWCVGPSCPSCCLCPPSPRSSLKRFSLLLSQP